MTKTAKGFVRKIVFLDAVEMVNHRHAAPANTQCGLHIGLGPIYDFNHLIPIGDIGKIQMLNWGASDDQPIKFFIFDCAEGLVEFFHVVGCGVFCLMFSHAQERQFNLQRCGTNQPGKLIFCLDFKWHEIEQRNAQWSDVLTVGMAGIHHHYTLSA